MPWQFYLGLALGSLPGGLIGYLVGGIARASKARDEALKAVEEADAKADKQRESIEEGLNRVLDETRKADGKELEDALNEDFSRPPALPGDHPLRNDGARKSRT